MKIGPEELKNIPFLNGEILNAPDVPFSAETLRAHENDILIFTPRIEKLSIVGMREIFGIDPAVTEPCMYNQDWYIKEEFANTPPDGKWHLIRKDVLEEARAKLPEEIETLFVGEEFPSAVMCAFTFFAHWFATGGEKLWKHDFVWCSDKDHNGDRIYVGRYEDPTGVNKNGFNIHRHLSLRPAHSTAPEIKP